MEQSLADHDALEDRDALAAVNILVLDVEQLCRGRLGPRAGQLVTAARYGHMKAAD